MIVNKYTNPKYADVEKIKIFYQNKVLNKKDVLYISPQSIQLVEHFLKTPGAMCSIPAADELGSLN